MRKCPRCELELAGQSQHHTTTECVRDLAGRYQIEHRELIELRRQLKQQTAQAPRPPSPAVTAALFRIEQRLNFLIGAQGR